VQGLAQHAIGVAITTISNKAKQIVIRMPVLGVFLFFMENMTIFLVEAGLPACNGKTNHPSLYISTSFFLKTGFTRSDRWADIVTASTLAKCGSRARIFNTAV